MPEATTTVYTDGACLGNPGPGGWAWAVPDGPFASGPAQHTTNQRMEVQAVLEALRALRGGGRRVEVVSDSTYVVNCFRDRWWEGWVRRGWRNSAGKPVANRDLWEPLVETVCADPRSVSFRWVKGHSNDVMNDLVDRLAVEAARRQEGRTGDRPPAVVGDADDPGVGGPLASNRRRFDANGPVEVGGGGVVVAGSEPGRGDDPRAPAGHRLLVVGHRPPELGGYGPNPVADGVRERLGEIVAAKRRMHPDLVVLTGMGLGAEQLGAEAAVAAGVPYVAVLAYPEFDGRWPASTRARHRELLGGAAGTVVLQSRPPDSPGAVRGALSRRDAWLARHADEAVAVWDGEDPAVGKLVRSLRDRLGDEEVWVLEPPPA